MRVTYGFGASRDSVKKGLRGQGRRDACDTYRRRLGGLVLRFARNDAAKYMGQRPQEGPA